MAHLPAHPLELGNPAWPRALGAVIPAWGTPDMFVPQVPQVPQRPWTWPRAASPRPHAPGRRFHRGGKQDLGPISRMPARQLPDGRSKPLEAKAIMGLRPDASGRHAALIVTNQLRAGNFGKFRIGVVPPRVDAEGRQLPARLYAVKELRTVPKSVNDGIRRTVPSSPEDIARELDTTKQAGGLAAQRVLDVDGKIYTMLPLLQGDLDGATRRLRSDGERRLVALSAVAQAATQLQRAHDRGVMHRDVKPDNLLHDKQGQVHVADFGVAATGPVVLDAVGRRHVHAQGMGGALAITAPEMLPDALGRSSQYDQKVDVWSLGITAGLLCGAANPFDPGLAARRERWWRPTSDVSRLAARQQAYRDWRTSIGNDPARMAVAQRPEHQAFAQFFARLQAVDPALAGSVFDMLQPDPRQRPEMAQVASRVGQRLAALSPPERRQLQELWRNIGHDPKTDAIINKLVGDPQLAAFYVAVRRPDFDPAATGSTARAALADKPVGHYLVHRGPDGRGPAGELYLTISHRTRTGVAHQQVALGRDGVWRADTQASPDLGAIVKALTARA